MHYIDIDWVPSAIAIAVAVFIVASLRVVVWLGKRRADARTERAIERVLNDWDRDEAGSKHA
jgi:predicted signal transduction protein with EAL and GGDEF domain